VKPFGIGCGERYSNSFGHLCWWLENLLLAAGFCWPDCADRSGCVLEPRQPGIFLGLFPGVDLVLSALRIFGERAASRLLLECQLLILTCSGERHGRHFGLRLSFLRLHDPHEELGARLFVDPAGLGFMPGLAVALVLLLRGLFGLTL